MQNSPAQAVITTRRHRLSKLKSRAALTRLAALVLMILIEVSVTTGFQDAKQPTSDQLSGGFAQVQTNQAQQGPVVSTCGPIARREGEYERAGSYTKSVASIARRKVGVHRWLPTDVKFQSRSWESDVPNTTNDFLVFQYKLNSAVNELNLDIGGDQSRLDFQHLEGTPPEGGLMLAVYPGDVPATLFKAGSTISFGKPAFLKKWTKPGTIELFAPVRFSTPVKEFSLVVVGADPWEDSSVSIKICRLRVLQPKPAYLPRKK